MAINHLAIVYIVLNVVWTVTVLAGSIILWRFRRHESIRKRNAGLTIAAVWVLQIYWAMNMIMYPLNGAYPCDLNYWVMSIYFPLGIALFQLQNVQLLSVSARQRDLRRQPFRRSNRLTLDHLKFWSYGSTWRKMTLLSRIYFFISTCIATQVILSFVIFFVSRKFVSFGIDGHPEPRALCTHGWQWVVTILYQAVWTYFFGPWLLWRIRKINDVFHWKLQTVLAIFFSLPGLPMWLIATNVPAWSLVTAKFPNGCWYNPGICVMQAVALFFPLYEIYASKHRGLRTWSRSEKTLQVSSDVDIESQIRESKYSLQAFEAALEKSPAELLEFAATREFTGENIIFLHSLNEFKASWNHALTNEELSAPEQRQKYFRVATEIYDRNVSLHTSQFPVNIESHIYHELDDVFGREVISSSSVIAPFADDWSVSTLAALNKASHKYKTNGKPSWPMTMGDGDLHPGMHRNASSEYILSARANAVPDNFNVNIFDKAEHSVKQMVFSNTWPRYVDSWRQSRSSTLSTGTAAYLPKGSSYFTSRNESAPGE